MRVLSRKIHLCLFIVAIGIYLYAKECRMSQVFWRFLKEKVIWGNYVYQKVIEYQEKTFYSNRNFLLASQMVELLLYSSPPITDFCKNYESPFNILMHVFGGQVKCLLEVNFTDDLLSAFWCVWCSLLVPLVCIFPLLVPNLTYFFNVGPPKDNLLWSIFQYVLLNYLT